MTSVPALSASLSGRARISFGSLVHAEFLSLFSLRSTYVTLAVGGVLTVVVSLAVGFLWIYSVDVPGSYAEATKVSLFIVQIAAVALGTSSFAREYSTGALRSLLAAAPRRVGILAAKAVVLFVSAFALTTVLLFVSLLSTAALYATQGIPDSVDGDVVVPLVFGGAMGVALTSVLALGVAAILRTEASTITTLLVFLFVFPSLVALIPSDVAQFFYEILFMNASASLTTPLDALDSGFARDVLASVAWPAAAFAAGAILMVRRDA